VEVLHRLTPEERSDLLANLTETSRIIIDRDYVACGFRDDIIEEIASTISERRREGGQLNPKSPMIEAGLNYCAERAWQLARDSGSDICRYLEMSLMPDRRWFRDYVLFRGRK
jgi:hypothetical protein